MVIIQDDIRLIRIVARAGILIQRQIALVKPDSRIISAQGHRFVVAPANTEDHVVPGFVRYTCSSVARRPLSSLRDVFERARRVPVHEVVHVGEEQVFSGGVDTCRCAILVQPTLSNELLMGSGKISSFSPIQKVLVSIQELEHVFNLIHGFPEQGPSSFGAESRMALVGLRRT